MKLFGGQNRKKLPKTLEKHYLEKVFASRFREVEKPYKTNGKQLFQKSKKAIRKPYKNLRQMNSFGCKNAKRPPRTLKRHYLEKVCVWRFREVQELCKTNGRITFPAIEKRYQKSYENLSQIKEMGPKTQKGL